MKTKIDIPEALLRVARKLAEHKGTILRALVVKGLQQVVEEGKHGQTFRLRKVGFKGRGLRLRDASWEQLRALAYECRGG